MIVVTDATPIHYLLLIGAVDVLKLLYSRVLIPETVAGGITKAWDASRGSYLDCEAAGVG